MLAVNRFREILIENFRLDEDDLTITRLVDGWGGKYKAGDKVIPYKLCKHGYSGIHIPRARTTVPYHHLLCLLRGIEIPDDAVIDHINGDTSDNMRDNLRVTTQKMNCRNTRMKSSNSTGTTGISVSGTGFVVRKQLGNTRVYGGYAKTIEEAESLMVKLNQWGLVEGYTERHGK